MVAVSKQADTHPPIDVVLVSEAAPAVDHVSPKGTRGLVVGANQWLNLTETSPAIY